MSKLNKSRLQRAIATVKYNLMYSKKHWNRLILLALNACCILFVLVNWQVKAQANVSFSHVIVDPQQIKNGHKPKVIGDFDNSGYNSVGALSGGAGFKLYKYPNFTANLITTYSKGGNDEDARAVDVNSDGALDIVIGGLGKQTAWLENPLKHGKNPYTNTWQLHPIDYSHQSHDLVVGDINKDHKPDVATDTTVYIQKNPDSWTVIGTGQIARGPEGTSLGNLLGDGYLDLVAPTAPYGSQLAWFENPLHSGHPVTDHWQQHIIDQQPQPSGTLTTAIADLNHDGKPDVAMAPMYNNGNLVWYQAPADLRTGSWQKHTIGPIHYVHQNSLQVADFDGNGTPDIAFAEQEQSSSKRIGVFYNTNGNGMNWSLQVLATTGGHNIKAGIIGKDAHPSILSANHGFFGAHNPVELWRNLH